MVGCLDSLCDPAGGPGDFCGHFGRRPAEIDGQGVEKLAGVAGGDGPFGPSAVGHAVDQHSLWQIQSGCVRNMSLVPQLAKLKLCCAWLRFCLISHAEDLTGEE